MKNSTEIVRRAWNRLRLTLVWARKCGALRLRVVPKYLKCLGHTTPIQTNYYYERELSFDKTPIFHVNMYRPSSMCFPLPPIPCINPRIDFEDDKYDHGMGSGHHDEEYYYGYEEEEEAAEIDKQAEEFIVKFYQQMKLQRQTSSLQYNQTPNS